MKLFQASVVLIVAATALAGCSAAVQTPTPTPPPTVVVDTSKYIGGLIEPAGTVWTGTDSGGDSTTFTLHSNGTVAVSYGTNNYDYPGDTWRVDSGVLKIEVFLDKTL